ncbi:hypothetical protein T492DRAFT_865519 [Pavlovales sp. CCMP2436]|nr:hypothetical protein T492DRAFT_865519 [Pavlovales sp. CCMP2436]
MERAEAASRAREEQAKIKALARKEAKEAAAARGGAARAPATRRALQPALNATAPSNSIAAGADYGRLRTLEDLGLETRPSTLEKLVLATARVHFVVVKVVSLGVKTDRCRLSGHSVVFSHARINLPAQADFGVEAIRSALDGVRVLFIGPHGQRSRLEKSALLVDDLRLRPGVIFNSLGASRHDQLMGLLLEMRAAIATMGEQLGRKIEAVELAGELARSYH